VFAEGLDAVFAEGAEFRCDFLPHRESLRLNGFLLTYLHMKNFLSLTLALPLSCTLLFAQDFESDSLYYTPIPRPHVATVENNVRIFRDTTARNGVHPKYYFDVAIGMLAGCADCPGGSEFTFTTSTTHGVVLGKKVRAGLGVGLDTYHGLKTMPMFLSAGYDIIGTRNTHAIFVQGQFGWCLAWFDSSTSSFLGLAPTEEKGGVMFAALAGYRIKYHNLRIAISTGFKHQSVQLIHDTPVWVPSDDGGFVEERTNRRTVDMDLGRAVVNLVFSWR